MKKISALLSFLLFLQISFAQYSKTYLIVFKDKKNSSFSIFHPDKFLSEKSIARRQKQNIAIDESDLPVNGSYISAVKDLGLKVEGRSKWLNAITVSTSDENKLNAIKKMAQVISVTLIADSSSIRVGIDKFEKEKSNEKPISDLPIQKSPTSILNYGPSFFQANQISIDCMHDMGYMGQGMIIAVLDAGFYKADSLPAFDSLRTNNQILGCRDFVTGDTMVYEDFPHGMNVLSCMGGNLPGQLVGTAPKANYWLLRTEDAATETLQEEINWLWAAEFADSVGADVINSSLGYSKFDGGIGDHFFSDLNGNTTIITNAADWAVSKGIFVTTSAGNSGGPPWFKITAPADANDALTVGAVDSAGFIAGFSSRGLTYDGRIKPNTCARGVQAVIAGNSGGITTAGGTSFSSPITAGAVACLWQANPGANVAQLLYAIERSGDQFFFPDSIKGYGIPDFCFADSILGTMSIGINETLSRNFQTLTVFPNPFDTDFVIEFYSTKQEMISIELFDITGRKIADKGKFVYANADNKFTINELSSVSKGVYTLHLKTSDNIYISKIIKK